MEELIAKMREAAQKAGGVDWEWWRGYELSDGYHWALHEPGVKDRVVGLDTVLWHRWATAASGVEIPQCKNASHIAIASPANILKLLGYIEELQKTVAICQRSCSPPGRSI